MKCEVISPRLLIDIGIVNVGIRSETDGTLQLYDAENPPSNPDLTTWDRTSVSGGYTVQNSGKSTTNKNLIVRGNNGRGYNIIVDGSSTENDRKTFVFESGRIRTASNFGGPGEYAWVGIKLDAIPFLYTYTATESESGPDFSFNPVDGKISANLLTSI